MKHPFAALLVPAALALACGRTPATFEPLDGSGDSGRVDDPTSEQGAMDLPPPALCTGTEIFTDRFESESSDRDLGSRWSVVQDGNAYEGSGSLLGTWGDFGTGCPVQSTATVTYELDLSRRSSATLELQHIGAVCTSDAVWVQLSAPGTPTSAIALPPPQSDRWTTALVDLSGWLGYPSVQLALGFENVCGDACGVEWRIDDLRICAE